MNKLCTLLVSILSSQVVADVIVFDNIDRAYFMKYWANGGGDYSVMDITKPPSEQPDQPGEDTPIVESTMCFTKYYDNKTSTEGQWWYLSTTSGSGAAIFSEQRAVIGRYGNPQVIPVPKLYSPGDIVEDDGSSTSTYPTFHLQQSQNGYVDYNFVPTTYTIGIRFVKDGIIHFGFVTMMTNNANVIAWGYESQPGVGLVVPFVCPVDLAEPFGSVDFFDLSAFLADYESDSSLWYERYADYAEPYRVLNFFDIAVFLQAFSAGCP